MKKIEVVCALIKNNNNQIFCCQRGKNHSLEGFWEFPGGKIEANETREEALTREILEELDTLIKPIEYITTITHVYPKTETSDAFVLTMHAFYCTLIKGSLTLKEHSAGSFKTIQEMTLMNFADADKLIIKEIINKR